MENNFNSLKYVGSAVTIITAVSFCIGWIYLEFYFYRLGIPHESINLPVFYYLLKSIFPISLFLLIIWFSFSHSKGYSVTTNQALMKNIIVLMVGILGFYILIKGENDFNDYLATGLWIPFWLYIWIKSSKLFTLDEIGNKKNPRNRNLIIIIFFFLILLLFSGFLGTSIAIITIEGTNPDIQFINFSWKDESPVSVEGDLIYIIHNEGNYYTVKKQKPVPDTPEVYIISDSQIEFASIRNNKPDLMNNFLANF